jgi:hypothetical protein
VIKVNEFHPQDRGLETVEATAQSFLVGVPIFPIPVHALASEPVGDGVVVSHAYPSVTKSAKVFGRVEGETAHVPKRSYMLSSVGSSMGMRTILNKSQIVSGSNRKKCIEIYRLAVQMYRKNRSCVIRNGGLQ